MSIKDDIERLENHYNADHDLFDGPIQMNYVDKRLLDLIVKLVERITELENELVELKGYLVTRI